MWACRYSTLHALHFKLSLNVHWTDSFVSSPGLWELRLPSQSFSLLRTQGSKRGHKAERKSAGVSFAAYLWFICGSRDRNHRNFSGNTFAAGSLSLSLSNSRYFLLLLVVKLMLKNHNRCKGNKQLPAIFSADNLHQTKVWVYQEERICRLAYTDTASSDEWSRCFLACGFVTCKLGWLTDISLMYMLGNDERTDSK